MEKLNGRKAYIPKTFHAVCFYSGSLNFNPSEFIDSLLIKNLLYHSYGNECSIEDYSIELGIARPYIEEYVNKLERSDFLIKKDNKKYLTNICFIGRKEKRKILDFLRDNIDPFYNEVIKYATDNLKYFKSLLDNPYNLDEYLMWSFLFIIISFVENVFTTEITRRKDGQYWDVLLEENVDKLYSDEFFISKNSTIGTVEGHKLSLTAFPSSPWDENSSLQNLISEKNALDGCINLKVLYEVLIKQKKYNDLDIDTKKYVTEYIQNGFFDLNENDIIVNIPILTHNNYNKLKENILSNKTLINAFQDLFNNLLQMISKLVPSYLTNQIPFVISGVTNTVRSIIISRAYFEGIIKSNKPQKKFVFNGFILK